MKYPFGMLIIIMTLWNLINWIFFFLLFHWQSDKVLYYCEWSHSMTLHYNWKVIIFIGQYQIYQCKGRWYVSFVIGFKMFPFYCTMYINTLAELHTLSGIWINNNLLFKSMRNIITRALHFYLSWNIGGNFSVNCLEILYSLNSAASLPISTSRVHQLF